MRISDWSSDVCASDLTALTIAAAVLLTALILYALQHLTQEIRYRDLLAAIHRTSPGRVLIAVLATAASFVALSGYDFSSLRYVGASVKPRVVMLTSFVAYALGNTVGLGVLTGGAVRMRSEEHTSELQSLMRISYAVFCLKNKKKC